MLPAPPLVLASTSRWRQQLLLDAGVPVALVAPPADESAVQDADPVRLARARARLKAESVAALRPDAWVIGADQVAHLDGEAFGKPLDPDDHRARLRALRGRTHVLTTGVCVVVAGRLVEFTEDTHIRFRAGLTDAELDAYVATGEGSACAGGYRAEALGAQLIAEVQGDWANVIGLPVYPLISVLRANGWRPTFRPAG